MNKTFTRLSFAAAVLAAGIAVGWGLASWRAAQAMPALAQQARWRRRPRHRPPASARCCIGTTRWCRRRSSTSPASRRSWTCSWCRAMPTKATPRPAAWRCRRRPRSRSACAWRRCEKRAVGAAIDAVGTVQLNERDISIVQARTAGFVERVYARAPGDVIAAGAPLVDVLNPEWLAAQQEYLAVKRTGDDALTQAARSRLTLLGMPAALVEQADRSGQPVAVQTITAPIGGVIAELMVRQGMTVAAGMTLARINGLATVWLEVALPEAQAATVRAGAGGRGALPGAARPGGQGSRRRGAARGQPRHAHAAPAHRAAQPGPAAARGPVRAGQPARAAARGAGGAGREP